MNHCETITAIAAALVKAQSEMPSVTKDRTNPAFKFRYATLDAILETVKPVLAANGLAIFQSGGDSPPGSVTVETMLLHSSGEWIMSTVTLPLGKNDAQGVGSALTYGRRYGLSAALSLAADEDDDANAASKPAKTATPATDRARARVAEQPTSGGTSTATAPYVGPAIDHPVKGKRLGDYTSPELEAMQKALRAEGKPQHKQLLSDIVTVLNDRVLGPSARNASVLPLDDNARGERGKAMSGAPDDLPFP